MVASISLGGIVCPLILAFVGVAIPAVVAREARGVIGTAVLLSLPLLVSVVVINVLLFSGGTGVMFEAGPFTVTADGVALAAEVAVRVLTIAGAVTLFYRTTRPAELVVDLEHRGVSPRLTFVIHNAIAMIPRLAERAAEVTDAQRARGLETERGVLARARGVVAIAAPTVIGAIEQAEARTMALEARGFGRPGPRTLLWHPPDGPAQRTLRWAATIAVAALLLARLLDLPLPC